jgi:hypothetical protein
MIVSHLRNRLTIQRKEGGHRARQLEKPAERNCRKVNLYHTSLILLKDITLSFGKYSLPIPII